MTEYELCKRSESAEQQRKHETRRRREQVLFTLCDKNSTNAQSLKPSPCHHLRSVSAVYVTRVVHLSHLPWLWIHCCSSCANVNRINPTSLGKACNGSNAKGMWITRGLHTRQITTHPTQPHQLARKITRFTQINENQWQWPNTNCVRGQNLPSSNGSTIPEGEGSR